MTAPRPQLLPRPEPNLALKQRHLPPSAVLDFCSCTLSLPACWTLLKHRGPFNAPPPEWEPVGGWI